MSEVFASMPWRRDERALRNWEKGQTGIPIVDAGMRQLWETGWMHNRVRMITASFLIKHLLIHWREGEEWFWDTLVDADLANNSASWQWRVAEPKPHRTSAYSTRYCKPGSSIRTHLHTPVRAGAKEGGCSRDSCALGSS